MKKSRYYIVVLVISGLLVSGLAREINAGDKSSALISAVATVYGGPYAGLLGSFIKVLGKKKQGQEGGYVLNQGGYSQQGYQPQASAPAYDPYAQGNQQQGGSAVNDPYSQQGYQPQVSGSGYQDPYAQQGYQPQTSVPAYDPYAQGNQQQGGSAVNDPYSQQGAASQERATRASGGSIRGYSGQLEVTMDVLKEVNEYGKFTVRQVNDGDTLDQRDNYKVQYTCNMECYVYVAQLDATGKLDPIVPGKFVPYRNPMTPNALYSVPAGNNWFFLDSNRGVEQIYFIASRMRRPDIEELFMRFANANATLAQQTPFSVQSPVVLSRGIGGMRKGNQKNVSFQNNSTGQYTSSLFSSIQADMVITRWFNHQ